MQMLAGFVANDPVEATYLNVSLDSDSKPLTGRNRYIVHFDKGGQPKVKAFSGQSGEGVGDRPLRC